MAWFPACADVLGADYRAGAGGGLLPRARGCSTSTSPAACRSRLCSASRGVGDVRGRREASAKTWPSPTCSEDDPKKPRRSSSIRPSDKEGTGDTERSLRRQADHQCGDVAAAGHRCQARRSPAEKPRRGNACAGREACGKPAKAEKAGGEAGGQNAEEAAEKPEQAGRRNRREQASRRQGHSRNDLPPTMLAMAGSDG